MAETTPDVSAPHTGHGFAYLGASVGAVVSIAANIAHSYLPPNPLPEGVTPDTWKPEFGAVLSAVFWPVALFIAIEVLVRVPWPDAWYWWAIRILGLVPIAATAAVVSYRHLSGLLVHYGEDGFTSTFGPVAVDGMMVICSAALIARRMPAAVVVVEQAATGSAGSGPAAGLDESVPPDPRGADPTVSAETEREPVEDAVYVLGPDGQPVARVFGANVSPPSKTPKRRRVAGAASRGGSQPPLSPAAKAYKDRLMADGTPRATAYKVARKAEQDGTLPTVLSAVKG